MRWSLVSTNEKQLAGTLIQCSGCTVYDTMHAAAGRPYVCMLCRTQKYWLLHAIL